MKRNEVPTQVLLDLWVVRWGYDYVKVPVGPEADEEALSWFRIAKKLGNADLMGSVTAAENAVICKLKKE